MKVRDGTWCVNGRPRYSDWQTAWALQRIIGQWTIQESNPNSLQQNLRGATSIMASFTMQSVFPAPMEQLWEVLRLRVEDDQIARTELGPLSTSGQHGRKPLSFGAQVATLVSHQALNRDLVYPRFLDVCAPRTWMIHPECFLSISSMRAL